LSNATCGRYFHESGGVSADGSDDGLLLRVGHQPKRKSRARGCSGDFAEVSSAGRTVVKMSVRAYRWEMIASGFGALGRLVGRGDAPPPPWDRGVSHRLGAGLRVVER